MRKLAIGMVVTLDGKFYIYTPGVDVGSFILLPIQADPSRDHITVNSEVQKKLKLWGDDRLIPSDNGLN